MLFLIITHMKRHGHPGVLFEKGSEKMSDKWTMEDTKNVGRVFGMIGKGILLCGIGLAIGIPFLGLLSGDKEYPLE
jgi:hypothetical protein